MYDFLLVINTNLPHILHRFQDVAFDRSKIAIWLSLLCLTPQAEGFNWDDLRKKFLWVSMAGQGTKCRRKNAENYNRVSRVHERYRRQRDDRWTGDIK